MRYRTVLPVLAVAQRDSHEPAISIPAGKVMIVTGVARDHFVPVEVDGEQFRVWETDLTDRCIALRERGRAASQSASA